MRLITGISHSHSFTYSLRRNYVVIINPVVTRNTYSHVGIVELHTGHYEGDDDGL